MGAPRDIQFEHNYAEMERGVGEMFRLYGEGKARANIQTTYTLEDFRQAFDLIQSRSVMGKVVLTI